MKYTIIIFSILLLLCCCRDTDLDDFKRNCPYGSNFNGHYLRVPITIAPHQMTYTVGDTLEINTVYSDSIYDLEAKRTFKIEGFPFQPRTGLYKINNNSSHSSGYTLNELLVDPNYQPKHWKSSKHVDGYHAKTIYKENRYTFESKLVLQEPGRYILAFTDLYKWNESFNRQANAEANAIRFEGQCIDDDGKRLVPTFICSMIDSGDDHLDQFESELLYLDKEVYRGALRFQYPDAKDVLEGGALSVEFSGYFGFEVVE